MRIVSRQPSERAPARVEPLAVLPVFFDLRGKRAIVAGGSAAAAWKAELLAAAGAHVEIHAPTETLGAECLELLASATGAGSLTHRDGGWDAAVLAGAAVAVCDAQSDDEAEAFRTAAQNAGTPVNVIDRPAHCSFQFGSIVNRSPVVIGISTEGAAPILGQAIRRRIETLLPPSLAAWAGLARRLRARLNERLLPGAQRRRFWEGFVDRAFGPAPGDGEERNLLARAERIAEPRMETVGRVTLVGAGPGDAELLTLKAVRALQAADVILFDDLVSDAVLELARREAKRILVGKRGGRESCKQDDINDMMVSLAKAGRHVVRLKSGDPMIFGRAGEEIERLAREGIAVDIVPGISAGIAMAAAFGVSLTHRDCAKSVRFVTGHSRNRGLPEDLDWNAIADPTTTTVFYMGGRTAGQIADRLIALGLSPDMPVAIASGLGRREEVLRSTSLHRMEQDVAEIGVAQPIIIGIGRVFEGTRPNAALALAR